MIKITLGNSYSKIEGLAVAMEKGLREALSYTVGGSGAHFSRFGPRKASLLSKRGDFPTGLLERVKQFLGKVPRQMVYNKPANFRSYLDLEHKYAYKWQLEALDVADNRPRGSIRAPTGAGKSMAMAMFAKEFGLKTLWIVPSLEIKAQTIASWGHLTNVTIENIDNPKLKNMTDFDMLLIDECHHAAAKTYHKLNKAAWTNIYYRYAFSATTFRNDPEEQLLYEAICGGPIYTLTYKDAVENKYIVPIESYYIQLKKKSTDAYTYREVYDELVVNNIELNTAAAQVLTSLHSSQKHTLCLVREVKHGKILSKLTGLPFVSGDDEESRRYIQLFNQGVHKVIIGTTGILGEGVDTKPCEYVLIAGSGKAKSQFMQQCGRAVRTYPGKASAKVIIIKEPSHKYLTRHFSAQKRILKEEYNSIPVKLDL